MLFLVYFFISLISCSKSPKDSLVRTVSMSYIGTSFVANNPIDGSFTAPVISVFNAFNSDEILQEEGLFRAPGNVDVVRSQFTLLSEGKPLDKENMTGHVLASLLKRILAISVSGLFHEEEEGVLDMIMDLFQMKGSNCRRLAVIFSRNLIARQPAANRIWIRALLRLLNQVAAYQEQNKMDAINIARAMWPQFFFISTPITSSVAADDPLKGAKFIPLLQMWIVNANAILAKNPPKLTRTRSKLTNTVSK